MGRVRKMLLAGLVGFCTLSVVSLAGAAQYAIDPVYSSVSFTIEELGGHVIGVFRNFGGIMELSNDQNKLVSMGAIVDIRSVYTGNMNRDRDLRSNLVFDQDKFPDAKFIAKKIDDSKITGDLTIKGKTKEISFDYTLKPPAQERGQTQIALIAKGTISRKDFGIAYNRELDGGRFLIADQVELQVEFQGVLEQ